MARRSSRGRQNWLKDFSSEQRRVLRRFGIAPDRDPRAPTFNARLLALAERGLRGMDLAMAAGALHSEVFGCALMRAANAKLLGDLIERNDACHVEQLALVVMLHEGTTAARLARASDLPYVMRSLAAVADVLDAARRAPPPSSGLVQEPPPASEITEEQQTEYRADIDAFLHRVADLNDRGDIAGTAAIVFSRRPAVYRFAGGCQTP